MANRPDPTLVSPQTFARLSGAQPGEIETLLRTGVIRRAGPGKISLVEATRALIEHVKSCARDASLVAAQAEGKTARAEAAELALLVENRELIPDEQADAAVDHVAGAIITAISCIPARASRDIHTRAQMDANLRTIQDQIAKDLAAKLDDSGGARSDISLAEPR